MKITRRDLAAFVPALAAAQAVPSQSQEKPVLPSKTYRFEDLPVVVNGENKTRAVFAGKTHTGFPVDMHITELGPGMAPHPAHHHVHEELLMLQTGQLDVTIMDKVTRATAGSVVYINSNEEHGWKNPGPDRARYFVVAIGRE